MNKIARPLMLVFALLVVGVVPTLAQGQREFEAEVDCDGVFNPGDTVPLALEFTNQISEVVEVSLRLTLDIPGFGERKLMERSVKLPPNQSFTRTWNLGLRQTTPNGDYTVTLVADSMTTSTFDTCSFHVQ